MAAALICLVVAAESCRSAKTVTVEVPVHDTTYITNNVHDSVFVESVVKEYIKGDTVFLESEKTKYIEKVRFDTVFSYKEKQVPITIESTKYVEKDLNWFQKTLMVLGVCFLVSVVALVALGLLNLKK